MKTLKELIHKLNDLKISQKSIDWIEDIPEQLYEELESINFKKVASNLDVIKYRWYETSITVYNTDLGIFGVESITDLFSESLCVSDIYHILGFFEMKEVQITTYKIK